MQANIAAAKYRPYPLSLSRLVTFRPGQGQTLEVTLENVTDGPMTDIGLDFSAPRGWSLSRESEFVTSLQPGETATVTYLLTGSLARTSGELSVEARWQEGSAALATPIRCADAVKINEIGLDNPFVEIYNAEAAEAEKK